MNVSVIIPAAGSGSRMGGDIAKQFLMLGGIPVILHLLKRIDMVDDVAEVIVALSEGGIDYFKESILADSGLKKKIKTVIGGNTRQESVRRALLVVDSGSGIIMVHDCVRPFVTPDMIRSAIARTIEQKATIAAVKVKDTIKEVYGDAVLGTLNRDQLVSVQTPQTFMREIIISAHENAERAGITGTDDSALVEKNGQKVFVINGSYDNIKITTNEDLDFAEKILKKQREFLKYY